MNIKANEVLLLDRQYNNMKQNLHVSPESQEGQAPVSNPQAIMNAMAIQGQNNMAFQGGAGKFARKAFLATALGVAALGSMTMTSCIKQEQEVNVDLTAIMEVISSFRQSLQDNNDLLREFNSQMSILIDMVREGLINQDEFYQRAYQWMTTNEQYMQWIYEQGQANGYTLDEIKDIVADIRARVEAGQISWQQAMNELLALVRNIDATLTMFFNEFMNFKTQYEVDKDSALAMISRIEHNGEIQVQNSTDIKNAVNALRNDVQQLSLTATQINNNLQDTSYHPTRDQYQAWFDQLGITVTNATTMAEQDLRSLLQTFLNTYIATEQTQTNLLTNISNNTDYLQYFPTATQQQNQVDSIIAAINAFRAAWQNGQGQGGQGQSIDYTQQLQDIYNAIMALKGSVDAMAGVLNTHVANFQTFYNNWQTATATEQQRLLDITTLQQDANAYLANLQAGQNILVNRTGALVNTNQHISDVLDSLAARGRDGMTFAEFSNFMQNQYGPQQYQNLLTWWQSTGMSSVPANVLRIADASEHIDGDIHELNRLTGQMDTVINMLRGANWNVILQTPGKLDSIMTILNGFDFCGCQNGNGNNEGRMDELGDELGSN